MARLSRALEAPGNCTRCGTWAEYRNTAGQCTPCHNKGYFERKAERKLELDQARERGRQYWAALGIKPGDKVFRFVVSWAGLGGEKVVGIAKVGACGAYVSAPRYQHGKMTCHAWQKV